MALEPGSPEWWLRRMHGVLVARRPLLDKAAEYYDGEHPLAFASKKFKQTFGGLFDAFADNWCGVVVDATEERLNVDGFRIADETEADSDAREIWQYNELDAQSQLGHTEALISGEAYATVWFGEEGRAEVTLEAAHGAVVMRHPKYSRRRHAGLRMYLDEWGYEHAELFLPDAVWLYVSKTQRDGGSGVVDIETAEWVPDISGLTNDDGAMENPLGVVPMIPLENRPRLRAPKHGILARSEIAQIIPLQDAVNKLVADLLVSSEADAMPFRYATGYSVKTDEETGEPVPPAFTDPQSRWGILEEEHGKFGSLPAGSLSQIVEAIELITNHAASISRTPPHYLSPSADRLSGESIKSSESGLVSKVRRKQRHFGEAWEEVMRVAGLVTGNARLATAIGAETIWQDPEIRTESQHVDAVAKKQKVGVPRQQLWEDLGYTQQQIERFDAMLAKEALLGVLSQPPEEPEEPRSRRVVRDERGLVTGIEDVA